jgi:ppGpp synthetase/RelA/SpoT-type nucleotidyltranferase
MSTQANDISKTKINKAGDMLIRAETADQDHVAFEQAMSVLSFWRSVHETPLAKAVNFARARAQKVDSKTVLAKRLKRTHSIIRKLKNADGMQLSRMQDIGGCRVIVATSKKVRKVVRALKQDKAFKVVDYLENPKEDGYRSVHLIGKFPDENKQLRNIEIQVRSAAQHSWATSVEIIDLFTSQSLKTNSGKPEWRDFFILASKQIDVIESIPLYNQLSRGQLTHEIYRRIAHDRVEKARQEISENLNRLDTLERKMRILKTFEGFAFSLQAADEHMAKEQSAGYALLLIDIKERHVDLNVFSKDQFDVVSKAYLHAEMNTLEEPEKVVALVSSDAVGGIKEAYPNFFADSTYFVKYIGASVDAVRLR